MKKLDFIFLSDFYYVYFVFQMTFSRNQRSMRVASADNHFKKWLIIAIWCILYRWRDSFELSFFKRNRDERRLKIKSNQSFRCPSEMHPVNTTQMHGLL